MSSPLWKVLGLLRVIKTRFTLHMPYVIITYGSGSFPASPGILAVFISHMWDSYQIRQTCGEVCPPGDTIIGEAPRTYGTWGDVEEKKQKGLTQNTPSFIVFTCQARFSKISHLKINANGLWSPTATVVLMKDAVHECHICVLKFIFTGSGLGSMWENSACQFKKMSMVSLIRP